MAVSPFTAYPFPDEKQKPNERKARAARSGYGPSSVHPRGVHLPQPQKQDKTMRTSAMKYATCAAMAAAALMTGSPARASDTDDRIESSFTKSYVNQTYLKDDAVRMSAKDGVVTLTGTVAEESHKTLAEQTAEGLPGVARVDNQLATKAEVAAENADIWIGRKVKLALLFHRNVDAVGTIVEVKDGVVTLKGQVANLAQKELTTEYAKDIENVIEVKNEMTLAAAPTKVERTEGEKIDDASVTAQVKSALSTHRSTSSIKTKVVTRNGEVTLTGLARNAAEKSLVTKLVSDIPGVTRVNNEMTIDMALNR